MISHRLDLALSGGVEARVRFTDRGSMASGGSSHWPYASANLASHVGDDPDRVTSNREALAAELGIAPGRMAFMHPNHGSGVHVAGEPTGVEPGREVQGVDALVTARSGIGLVALAADCVPVILVHTEPPIVAAVHSGWRGVVVDVIGAAVRVMRELGATESGLRAVLGPAICGQCYAVPADRAAQVRAVRQEAVGVARDGQPSIDVRRGVEARLAELGADTTVLGGCTAQDEALYSHRRDGRTGRQGGAVTIVPGA